MSENAESFRARAEHCRQLSQTTRDLETQRLLLKLADDFDGEAAEIERGQSDAPVSTIADAR